MMISFLCPTSGRLPEERHLLEEKLYWFTRQEKLRFSNLHELVILNDCKDQELITDVPGVRIVNYPHRFGTIGDKMNALCSLAKGDILIVDEDDDISLPNRASQAELKLTRKDSNGYWEPDGRWFQPSKDALIVPDFANCKHHASAFMKGTVVYPSMTEGHDWFMSNMYKPKNLVPSWHVNNFQYIYRWGVSKNHLSGNPDMKAAYQKEGLRKVEGGVFKLEPKMGRDYEAEVKAAILAHYS